MSKPKVYPIHTSKSGEDYVQYGGKKCHVDGYSKTQKRARLRNTAFRMMVTHGDPYPSRIVYTKKGWAILTCPRSLNE